MTTLRDQLTKLLPNLLSSDPSNAVNGTDLLERVKPLLSGEYSDTSIRQHFSVMSQDQTSPIAKVANGHGYYLRSTDGQVPEGVPAAQAPRATQESSGRETQLEEKFRSLVLRHSESTDQKFGMRVEHTRAIRRDAGVNQWKFPDIVLLKWEVESLADQGFKLDPHLLDVKTGLGEPAFSLESIELKVDTSLSVFREHFFQCVSNSKWAHGATLAIANGIDDKTLSDELRGLGASYDVSVITYGLSPEVLEGLPSASSILDMHAEEFEVIAAKISTTRISTGKERTTLDWEHLKDMRQLSPEFVSMFEWIAFCLSKKRAYTFANFNKIQQIDRRTA